MLDVRPMPCRPSMVDEQYESLHGLCASSVTKSHMQLGARTFSPGNIYWNLIIDH